MRKDINMLAANVLYKSYILAILDYCDGSVWGCCSIGNANKLEKRVNDVQQERSDDDAFVELCWESLERRRDTYEVIYYLVQKCLSGHVPQFLHNYFIFNCNIATRITRQSNLLHLPRVGTIPNVLKIPFVL